MADLVGKLLGKPLVGFKCKADQDQILKIAFGNTSEGRHFQKRFLELAQIPGGLAQTHQVQIFI